MAKLKRTKRTVVEEGLDWGIYAWQMEDGKVLGDSDGNVLNVPSMRGDLVRMGMISRFVKEELGIQGGGPVFLEGVQPLTEDEHDGQMEQLMNGYVPSLDVASAIDDARQRRRNERG